MAALCDVRERADAWLDDPDAVRAEFDALIAANFAAEPPGTENRPAPPPGGRAPQRRARRRKLRAEPVGTAPAVPGVARERSPPALR